MPQLNPYEEAVAPWGDRSCQLSEYRITVEYVIEDGEDTSHYETMHVEALNIDDALNIAGDIVKENHPELYDIINIFEDTMFS